MARLDLNEEQWTDRQRQAADMIRSGPRGRVSGPFKTLIHNPEATEHIQRLGEFLRFEGSLDARLRETAILVTARIWGTLYEWQSHEPLARDAGLSPEFISAIAEDRLPEGDAPECQVIRFCRELHRTNAVSDDTFERAEAMLGSKGVIELVTICGYYALLAMALNVAHPPQPGWKTQNTNGAGD